MSELVAEEKSTNTGEMRQQELPLAIIRGEVVIEKPEDLFIPPDALEVILDSFEGPLDLLLYLIRKQKFDIADIPIARITEQYMEYVELMRELKLELAAEYLVMAAILAEIKSRILLPKVAADEDEEDPRAELIRRLQEYEVIKKAAENMDELPRMERDTFAATADLDDDFEPLVIVPDVEMSELVMAFSGLLKRAEAFEHHHIQREALSTRERMTAILDTLTSNEFVAFEKLFTLEEGKSGVVVTFLAILELVKESLIECLQVEAFGQIHVKRRVS